MAPTPQKARVCGWKADNVIISQLTQEIAYCQHTRCKGKDEFKSAEDKDSPQRTISDGKSKGAEDKHSPKRTISDRESKGRTVIRGRGPQSDAQHRLRGDEMVACPQKVRARHVGRGTRCPFPAARRRLGTEEAGGAQLYGLQRRTHSNQRLKP